MVNTTKILVFSMQYSLMFKNLSAFAEEKCVDSHCINHNLSKAVWQAGCNAALITKDKSCSLSGYLSSQACR